MPRLSPRPRCKLHAHICLLNCMFSCTLTQAAILNIKIFATWYLKSQIPKQIQNKMNPSNRKHQANYTNNDHNNASHARSHCRAPFARFASDVRRGGASGYTSRPFTYYDILSWYKYDAAKPEKAKLQKNWRDLRLKLIRSKKHQKMSFSDVGKNVIRSRIHIDMEHMDIMIQINRYRIQSIEVHTYDLSTASM